MPGNNHHILILDDDVDVLNAARLLLKQHVHKVDVERNPRYLPDLIRSNRYDALLLDMNFSEDVSSGNEGFRLLTQVREQDPDLSVILITAYGDVEKAVRAVKEGATDFVLKPWQNEKLVATVSSAVQLTSSRRKVGALQAQQREIDGQVNRRYNVMIGESDAMKKVFSTIDKVAATDANVLILGENGTGKELVARALHRKSTRSDQIFLSVDMGAIPENLFESELFGYLPGAFTDARKEKPGRFEVAGGGTLFLDEIGNLPLPMQSKLLSVLETRTVTRLGSTSPVDIDIRLISATNMPIHKMSSAKEFRQDLLYRINTIEIELPPLRERPSDIPALANHFMTQYAAKYRNRVESISKQALERLMNYSWPGNIRELQHAVERAVILCDEDQLQPDDFLLHKHPEKNHDSGFEKFNLEELEKLAVQKALERNNGNISKTAEDLGLSRASLYRRMEKFGL